MLERRKFATEEAERAGLDLLAKDDTAPPKLKRVVSLYRAGLPVAPIGPQVLETPGDRKARGDEDFAEFQRRERFQDSLIRGRETARTPRGVTPQDRAEARRQARRDAILEYNARKDVVGNPGADLDALIEEYESDYLAILDAVAETGGADSGGNAPAVTPGSGGTPSFAPQLEGAPGKGRRVVRLTRRTPDAAKPAGNVIRYDAHGNRIQ
jgi:hypothetical protein